MSAFIPNWTTLAFSISGVRSFIAIHSEVTEWVTKYEFIKWSGTSLICALNLLSFTPLRNSSWVLGKKSWHLDPKFDLFWFLSTSKVLILLSSLNPGAKFLVPSTNVIYNSVFSWSIEALILCLSNYSKVSCPINLLADPNPEPPKRFELFPAIPPKPGSFMKP